MDEYDSVSANVKTVRDAIAAAAKHDIVLEASDFRVIDGDVYLDGMDPFDWIHAMTMD